MTTIGWAFEHPFLTFFIICAICEMISSFGPHCKDCHDKDEADD